MNWKRILLLTAAFVLAGVLFSFAQYNNSQQDPNAPPSLYPQPGPGELLIIDQLKETNRLLQQQNQLLTDQNQILVDTLSEMKRRDAAAGKTHSK